MCNSHGPDGGADRTMVSGALPYLSHKLLSCQTLMPNMDYYLYNRWNCAVSLHPIWILSIACAIQGPASIVAYQVRFVSFKPLVQVWVQVFELFQYLLMLSSTILKVNKMIFLSCSVWRQVRMQDKWTQHKLQNGIMVMVMEISMPNYI